MANDIVHVNLPPGFDPKKHLGALRRRIEQEHGDGFEIRSVNVKKSQATAVRQSTITEVSDDTGKYLEVNLPSGTTPAHGDKIAIQLKSTHPGYEMTKFEPFLGTALLTKTDAATSHARASIANALGVKTWEVQVEPRRDGGYNIELPATYVPSKHDEKLDEVATAMVGQPGWYVKVNALKRIAAIIPSEPPTFPGVIPFPFNELKRAPRDKLLMGMQLAEPGQDNEPLYLDFEAAPHTQISGTSGSGKSVTLNTMITGVLAGGAELVIIDLPHKAVDFFWCKDLVRDGGWGCASLEHQVTALALVYNEGQRRAKILAERGVTKWTELPPREQFKPIFVLLDEVTGLIQMDDKPQGVPKDHPMMQEVLQSNLLRATLLSHMKKIAAEMRFVGIRLVLSSQVSSVNTGIPTALRMNLAQKFLLGANPTDNNRKLALSDPTSVPKVPENVRQDGKAAKGVGVAELEGQPPSVFKSFYAPTEELRKALDQLGLPRTSRPEPTGAEIAAYTPSLEDEGPAAAPAYEGERAPSGRPAAEVLAEVKEKEAAAGIAWDNDIDPVTGKRLTGYAKANANRAAAKAGGQKPKGN